MINNIKLMKKNNMNNNIGKVHEEPFLKLIYCENVNIISCSQEQNYKNMGKNRK